MAETLYRVKFGGLWLKNILKYCSVPESNIFKGAPAFLKRRERIKDPSSFMVGAL